MAHSEELEDSVRERVRELGTYAGDILGCHVVVERPHQHHTRGNRCHVRVDVTTRDGPIVVSHEPSTYGALRDGEEAEPAKEHELDSTAMQR
jgi:hypothetical protein